jgi:hypothetical protein
MRLLTKACARCQGDLTRVDDIGDTYYSCVQCGHSMPEALALQRPQRRVSLVPPVPRAA